MQPSAFVTGGQGTMASGGGGIGHQLAHVTLSFSYVDGMHMGGGGQAPASAAASMAPGGGAHAISSSPQVTGGGQGAFLIAGGPAGHSARLGIQIGGIMQPSAFVTGGQGTMASGGGGIGHQLAHVAPSFSYVDGMHMGGGGQAPASAAASMAPGGGAHAISLSPQVT